MILNNVPVKKLVEFRRLSERRQATFANNLKIPKKPKIGDDSGGDYWKRSTSGLSGAYKFNDKSLVQEKIDSVLSVFDKAKKESTKVMYKRNLEILHNYLDFDFSIWQPSVPLKFLPNPKFILTIEKVPIQVIPHHVFSYENVGESYIGGIWFVCWLDGFKSNDLGIFSESLFQYLSLQYSKKYKVDPKYCLIVDIVSKEAVSYSQILEGKIPALLKPTVDILNKYLH